MMTGLKHRRAGSRGSALLLTIIFVALFASLALAIGVASQTNMVISRNSMQAAQASSLVETGIQLCQKELSGLSVEGCATAEDLHEEIADHLRTAWFQSEMVNTMEITDGADGVGLPLLSIQRADGQTGTIEIDIASDGGIYDEPTITVQSTGRFGNAVRTATCELTVEGSIGVLQDYGVASRSRIIMGGNSDISGANTDVEGSILSEAGGTAIDMGASSSISGNASVSDYDASIRTSGAASIGGNENYGVGKQQWPEFDTTELAAMTDGGEVITGNVSGGEHVNARIPAGTNPTISGNSTFKGVLYVEQPNVVTFRGNVEFTGIIVTEDLEGDLDNLSQNKLDFSGNVSVNSVSDLPAGDPRFDGLRDKTGTFMIAPDFEASFTGNFGTLGGMLAADQLNFTGNAHGTLTGGCLNMSSTNDFSMNGNAHISIDKQNMVDAPAGVVKLYTVKCVPGSYKE